MASGNHRWADSKVYSRKPQPKSSARKSADEVNSSHHPSSPPPPPPLTAPSEDEASSLNRPIQSLINRNHSNRPLPMSKITLNSRSKQESRNLRQKLASELELVQNMVRKIEARELQSSDHTKKHKSIKDVERIDYTNSFNSCKDLLSKLMKHKHGWVFNVPVDVRKLNIPDYHIIIKRPMDLGTVNSRINKNWYKSPGEFAEDVRLTFKNAMIYNPKGQDVHVMAENLLSVFEECWFSIEAQYLNVCKSLERSDSTAHPHVGKNLGLNKKKKKPKAKDIDKRDMSFEEKQRLSNNLQNLPPEKLESIVQIIKKRNSSLSQHEDEIEVDIDSVDVETLWELDRFVTNYKKGLSKNKRKEKLAVLAKIGVGNNDEERVDGMICGHEDEGEHREGKSVMDEKEVSLGSQIREENKGGHAIRTNSSRRSSSGSGSSSSDSDSESSSAYESDGGQSARP